MFPVIYRKFIFSNARIIYTLAEAYTGVHNGNLFASLTPNFHAFWGDMRPGLLVLPLVLFFVILVTFAPDPSLVPLKS